MRPCMILLMGLPGSGKSTLSTSLVKAAPELFFRVNQDELKSRPACEKALLDELEARPPRAQLCYLVDRCNFDAKQRKTWVSIGRTWGLDIVCLFLDVPADACIHRVTTRPTHPTLAAQEAVRVIERFGRTMTSPRTDEGIHKILTLRLGDLPVLAGPSADYSPADLKTHVLDRLEAMAPANLDQVPFEAWPWPRKPRPPPPAA